MAMPHPSTSSSAHACDGSRGGVWTPVVLDLHQALEGLPRATCVVTCGLGDRTVAVAAAVGLIGGRLVAVECDLNTQVQVRRQIIQLGLDHFCQIYSWQAERMAVPAWRARIVRRIGAMPVGRVLFDEGGDFLAQMQLRLMLSPAALNDTLIVSIHSPAADHRNLRRGESPRFAWNSLFTFLNSLAKRS